MDSRLKCEDRMRLPAVAKPVVAPSGTGAAREPDLNVVEDDLTLWRAVDSTSYSRLGCSALVGPPAVAKALGGASGSGEALEKALDAPNALLAVFS